MIEVERYAYKDLDGALRFSVLRANPKDFRPLNPTGELNLKGVQIIPYRLPELQEAISAEKLVSLSREKKTATRLSLWASPAQHCLVGQIGNGKII